jgi:hypothetical protein
VGNAGSKEADGLRDCAQARTDSAIRWTPSCAGASSGFQTRPHYLARRRAVYLSKRFAMKPLHATFASPTPISAQEPSQHCEILYPA